MKKKSEVVKRPVVDVPGQMDLFNDLAPKDPIPEVSISAEARRDWFSHLQQPMLEVRSL